MRRQHQMVSQSEPSPTRFNFQIRPRRGVDFDTLLSNAAAARGHDRDASEAALDDLTEDGTVHEPRFGWFKITN